jgi:hypothetical protein
MLLLAVVVLVMVALVNAATDVTIHGAGATLPQTILATGTHPERHGACAV